MAWGVELNSGGSSNKAAGHTGLLIAPFGSIGDVIIICSAKNNIAIADAETNEITSITCPLGNTYTKAAEFTNAQGAAAAGATVAVFYSVLTAAYGGGTNVTINYSAAVDASGANYKRYTIGAGSTVSVEAYATLANDALDPGAMDLTVTNVEHLWVRAQAHEGPSTHIFTKSASYGTALNFGGTTGGAVATNMTSAGEVDIFTGTTNSSNPSWSAATDEASLLIAFLETAGAAAANPGHWRGKGGWF